MKVHDGELSDVTRYIEKHSEKKLEDREQRFDHFMRQFKEFRDVDENTKILEIGVGSGWFALLSKQRGMNYTGIEISKQLVEFAIKRGQEYNLEPNIRLGNVEDADLGENEFDIVLAYSTFEHVEHWEKGIENIFRALKPGGLFYFYSTNRFSFKSSEYKFPLYGWMPNWMRFKLRVARQGPGVMKLGIDFNQFTHPQLRRAFKKVGFSSVMDIFYVFSQRMDPAKMHNPQKWKVFLIKLVTRFGFLKNIILTFAPGTMFICIK